MASARLLVLLTTSSAMHGTRHVAASCDTVACVERLTADAVLAARCPCCPPSREGSSGALTGRQPRGTCSVLRCSRLGFLFRDGGPVPKGDLGDARPSKPEPLLPGHPGQRAAHVRHVTLWAMASVAAPTSRVRYSLQMRPEVCRRTTTPRRRLTRYGTRER